MEERRGEKRKRSGDSVSETSKMHSTQNGDFVNYFSAPPSLQHISAVSIAIELWSRPDVRREMLSKSETLEEEILSRLSSSSLPTSLKEQVSYVVTPIKLQLLGKFNSRYCRCTGCHKILCEYMRGGTIYWTVEGTIDIVKSCIELFNRENSENDTCHLYEAACYYCLEEYIPVLWKKVPPELKSQFRIGRAGDVYKRHVVIYWTSVLENNLDSFPSKVMRIDYENIYDRNLSVALNMITCSIRIGSKFALKYFWRKLTKEEKIAYLDKWLSQATRGIECTPSSMCEKYDETLDILCFLLSRVSSKFRLAEYFQNHSRVLMLLFENWPHQRMFLPTVLELLDCLEEEAYVSIMEDIGSELNEGGIGTNIFEEIWNASPPRLKRSFLQEKKTCAKLMLNFLELENRSMALKLLNGASEDEVKHLICYMFGWSRFCVFLYGNKLSLLSTLLSETALPPECNFHGFTFNYEDGLYSNKWCHEWHMCHEWLKKGDFQTVEIFLKWAFQSDDEAQQDFKKNTLDPCIMYVTFIVMRNYELADLFLKWYFETEDEIQQFKKDFLRDDDNSHIRLLLCELCSRPRTGWDILQEFLSYCTPSSEEMGELKRTCLNYVETVLQKRRYEFATELLNWSLDSTDDVKRYKNDFVVSEKGIKSKRLEKQMHTTDGDWKDVEDLIKWSLPLSEGTIAVLRSLIPCESNLKVKALLDSTVECNDNTKSESSSNYDNLPEKKDYA